MRRYQYFKKILVLQITLICMSYFIRHCSSVNYKNKDEVELLNA